LYVHGHGEITAADIDQYYASLKATSGINHCCKALINLASEGVSLEQAPIKNIKSLGRLFKHNPILPEGTKMAIVVRSSLAFGFVRLFMATRGEHITIRPFKNMDKALFWLQVTEEDFQYL